MRSKVKLNWHFFKQLPEHEKKITLSTVITLLRVMVVPFIVFSMVAGYWGVAFVLFVIAALTDLLDGNLARLLNEKTFLGACLDSIADKLLLLSCFFTLAFVRSPLFDIPLWFVLLVLCRELILVGGVSMLLLLDGHIQVRPTLFGKLTTVAQMGFIVWLFACYFFHWLPIKTYYTMLGAVILMVFLSLIQYIRIGLRINKH